MANISSKCGIGPKPKHFDELLGDDYEIGFLEFHTENLFAKGGDFQKIIKLREKYDFSLHTIGLSLGSIDGIDQTHLSKIVDEINRFEPIFISEHLSFAGIGGIFTPDLLPLPLNDECLGVLLRNIDIFQNSIKRKILIENPSQYFSPIGETYNLFEFLNLVAKKSGCGILLDVNNLEVCRQNIGISPLEVIEGLDNKIVHEIHLAGYKVRHTNSGKVIFLDNHGDKVFPSVWELYRAALIKFGNIPTLLEWDNDVPDLQTLLNQTQQANNIKHECLGGKNA